MTPLDIPKLRELLARATPGEWCAVNSFDNREIARHDPKYADNHSHILCANARLVCGHYGIYDEDAALIVEMRNQLPALLDRMAIDQITIERVCVELDAANARVERLREALDTITRIYEKNLPKRAVTRMYEVACEAIAQSDLAGEEKDMTDLPKSERWAIWCKAPPPEHGGKSAIGARYTESMHAEGPDGMLTFWTREQAQVMADWFNGLMPHIKHTVEKL